MRRGYVHLYTGNGKGKTSAAVGLCIRALGRGLKCSFIQFIKGRETGEMITAKKIPNFEFIQTGRPDYDFKPNDEDKRRAEEGLKIARDRMNSVDVLVLDEVIVAVFLELIEEEELLSLISEKPKSLELVLTGRHATKRLIEISDYVTEFQLIKHPFYRGEKARPGIDY